MWYLLHYEFIFKISISNFWQFVIYTEIFQVSKSLQIQSISKNWFFYCLISFFWMNCISNELHFYLFNMHEYIHVKLFVRDIDSFHWFCRNYIHLHLNEFSWVRPIYRFLEESLSLSLFTDDKGFNFKCNVVMDAVSHYIKFVMQMRVACDERRFLSLAYRSLSATTYERRCSR